MVKNITRTLELAIRSNCRPDRKGYAFNRTPLGFKGVPANKPLPGYAYWYDTALDRSCIAQDAPKPPKQASRPKIVDIQQALYDSRSVSRIDYVGYAFTGKAGIPANAPVPGHRFFLCFADNLIYSAKTWARKNNP